MPEPSELDLIRSHTQRTTSYHRRFGDGDPEFGSEEYAALPPAHRYQICLRRAGASPSQGDGVLSPKRYGTDEGNPLDREGW